MPRTISTHTPLAGRDQNESEYDVAEVAISTHTPLAGRDARTAAGQQNDAAISTHTPLAGRDFINFLQPSAKQRFLLTRPSRGATATYSIRIYRTSYIQEADSKIITKYAIKLNMLHDSGITSRRTSLDYTHHSTFAYYAH